MRSAFRHWDRPFTLLFYHQFVWTISKRLWIIKRAKEWVACFKAGDLILLVARNLCSRSIPQFPSLYFLRVCLHFQFTGLSCTFGFLIFPFFLFYFVFAKHCVLWALKNSLQILHHPSFFSVHKHTDLWNEKLSSESSHICWLERICDLPDCCLGIIFLLILFWLFSEVFSAVPLVPFSCFLL